MSQHPSSNCNTNRLEKGGLINRDKPLQFRFDKKMYTGFEGDTLASALLANNVQVIGRSFKYHRARGVWGHWFEEPNAIFNVRLGQNSLPNCMATTTTLANGMHARAVNAWPNAIHDVKGGLDWFHRWLSAGFYYKTFMWPKWHYFEPAIRRMAGLGAVEMSRIDDHIADQLHTQCDLLIIGAGAAGLAAARTASEAGRNVILVDDHAVAGGGVFRRGQTIEGATPEQWVAEQLQSIKNAGGQVLANTTAIGVYDHSLVALSQNRGFAAAPRLWRVRANKTILATGAIEQPLTFVNNDLPGIVSVDAACEYLGRYGVLVGKRVTLASNNNFAERSAVFLRSAGARVNQIDLSKGPISAMGRKSIRSVSQGDTKTDTDVLLVSGGWAPLLHLWCHAGGKLRWSDEHGAFLPGDTQERMAVIGAANGTFNLEQALIEARDVINVNLAPGQSASQTNGYKISRQPLHASVKGRQWIDFQHDVTASDISLAARENYVSVEHLKRYTTLGMAVDQGKTSNIAGLSAMAANQGKSIEQVGTTTFRPPFVPVLMELYHGSRHGQLCQPLKRLALEMQHRESGAALGEYGGWLRPAWYGERHATDEITSEVVAARNTVALMDASPLGKIEVMGPDAASFMDFMFYNTMSTLQSGQIRYGLMLTESGVIYDDAVVVRMSEHQFLISCSSSHVDGVTMALESWRQDGNDANRIFIHDTTFNWSTLTVSGPLARTVLNTLNLSVDTSTTAFPHMRYAQTGWNGYELRIARVSFTGEVSFEISIQSGGVSTIWQHLYEAVKVVGGKPVGLEASTILRAEKGYIIVGKDTDGETMPHDIGFSVPREKKKVAFVGDRGLHSVAANDNNRLKLVGLKTMNNADPIPTGAHIISNSTPAQSIGFVTSSYFSPTLGVPIALALLRNKNTQLDKRVALQHLGNKFEATVAPCCAFDPTGERLNA